MDKPTRNIALVYGYSVCLVAVITFLICVSNLVSSVADLSDPLHSGFNMAGAPSLASYEIYKMDILKYGQTDGNSKSSTFAPDDTAIRSMYEAAKADKIQKVRHDAFKSITISGIMVLIAVILFLTHWKWMKSRNEVAA